MNDAVRNTNSAGFNYRTEIDRLLSLEQNNRLDITIRLIGVPFGSLLLYLYADTLSAFVWSGCYVVCYLLYRTYLQTRRSHVSYSGQVVAHLLIVLLTISFLWMPALMMVEEDRNLFLVGAALVGSQLMHLVHRGDTPKFLIIGVTLAVFAIMIALLWKILPQISDPIAITGILLSWLALIFYLGQSLMAARNRILSENAAKLQIFQSQKMSALGQLAGGIAHDFNNILTAISGNLELYHEVDSPAEKDDVVTAAYLSSQRAAKIVSQILIYARKSPVEFQTVDVNEPLSSISVLTSHLVPSNIQLTVTPLETRHFVRIDPDQFVTAIMNLILNAVDAISGNGRIDVCATVQDARGQTQIVGERPLGPGLYIVYTVRDTGGGIPVAILNSVADPFFTTKPAGKGTGLGLSMAVSIAENAGGGLQIETSTDGTAMRIYVPVVA